MDTKSTTQVLLIDDNEADAVRVRRYLARSTRCKFEMAWIPEVDAGRAALRDSRFDVCLLDYHLGSETGLDLLEQVNAAGGCMMPVVLLTGQESLDMALHAMAAGATEYLEKDGLSPVLLERTIRYAIEHHRSACALRAANEGLERRVRERTLALERINVELARSNQELEQFAYVASHELQMPLKTLKEHLTCLSRQTAGAGGDALSGYFLERAHEGACRMESLVRGVLAYARVCGVSGPAEPVALGDPLQDALMALGSCLAEREVEIQIETLPWVQGHRELLAQVFQNLLCNAVKFCGAARPSVRVWAEPEEAGWVCCVADNGRGIEPDDYERVFQMFHRIDHGDAAPGHGIGLALCRRIIELHGGRIWVESVPGSGATFRFWLPGVGVCRDAGGGAPERFAPVAAWITVETVRKRARESS